MNTQKFNAFVVSDKDGKPTFAKIGAATANESGGFKIRMEDESQGDIYLFPQQERKKAAKTQEKTIKPAVTNH